VLIIDHEKCTLCKVCIKNCPFGALAIEDGRLQVNEACTLCGVCVNVCRFDALSIERRQASLEELAPQGIPGTAGKRTLAGRSVGTDAGSCGLGQQGYAGYGLSGDLWCGSGDPLLP